MNIRARFEFEPRDCWLGVYWKRDVSCGSCAWEAKYGYVRDRSRRDPRNSYDPMVTHEWANRTTSVDLFVCLVPMLPLHIEITRDTPLVRPDVAQGDRASVEATIWPTRAQAELHSGRFYAEK